MNVQPLVLKNSTLPNCCAVLALQYSQKNVQSMEKTSWNSSADSVAQSRFGSASERHISANHAIT
jgi:hypothetical protein